MDELNQMKAVLQTVRETLIFLTEQEKLRQKEIDALNEKIDAVNQTLMDNVITPAIEQYQQEQFDSFASKYGEKLGQFDKALAIARDDPEFSATRETWGTIQALKPEERELLDEEAYVDSVADSLSKLIADMKESLGLPPDAATTIEQDADGNIKTVVDTDGDGEVDTDVSEDIASAEEPAQDDGESDQENDIDPELAEQLRNY